MRRPDLSWPSRLFEDPAFEARVKVRWQELRPAFEAVAAGIPAQSATLADPVQRDALRWGWTPETRNDPAYLAGWLTQRIAWLDGQFSG